MREGREAPRVALLADAPGGAALASPPAPAPDAQRGSSLQLPLGWGSHRREPWLLLSLCPPSFCLSDRKWLLGVMGLYLKWIQAGKGVTPGS